MGGSYLRGCGPAWRRRLQHGWLFVRSLAALVSAVICWLGIWEIFELHLWPKSVGRDFAYVFVGAALMCVCGTFLSNCGIYEADDGSAAREEATQAAMVRAAEIDQDDDQITKQHHAEERCRTRSRTDSHSHSGSGSRRMSNADRGLGLRAIGSNGSEMELDQLCQSSDVITSGSIRSSADPGHPRAAPVAPSPHGCEAPHSPRPSHSNLERRSSRSELLAEEEDVGASASASPSYAGACLYLLTRLCSWRDLVRVYIASFVSLLASIAFWTGAYNLLLEFFFLVAGYRAALAYSLNLLIGWALMWLTGTLFEQAGLEETKGSAEEEECVDSGVAMSAAAAAAAAASHLQSSSIPPPLHATSAPPSVRRAHVPTRVSSRVRVYIRAVLAVTGCMMFWLGASMLLEQLSALFYTATPAEGGGSSAALHCNECTESTPARNAIFIIIAIIIFLLTDTVRTKHRCRHFVQPALRRSDGPIGRLLTTCLFAVSCDSPHLASSLPTPRWPFMPASRRAFNRPRLLPPTRMRMHLSLCLDFAARPTFRIPTRCLLINIASMPAAFHVRTGVLVALQRWS